MFSGLAIIMVGFKLVHVYQSQVGVGLAKKFFNLHFTLHHAHLKKNLKIWVTYTVQLHVQ